MGHQRRDGRVARCGRHHTHANDNDRRRRAVFVHRADGRFVCGPTRGHHLHRHRSARRVHGRHHRTTDPDDNVDNDDNGAYGTRLRRRHQRGHRPGRRDRADDGRRHGHQHEPDARLRPRPARGRLDPVPRQPGLQRRQQQRHLRHGRDRQGRGRGRAARPGRDRSSTPPRPPAAGCTRSPGWPPATTGCRLAATNFQVGGALANFTSSTPPRPTRTTTSTTTTTGPCPAPSGPAARSRAGSSPAPRRGADQRTGTPTTTPT